MLIHISSALTGRTTIPSAIPVIASSQAVGGSEVESTLAAAGNQALWTPITTPNIPLTSYYVLYEINQLRALFSFS